MIINSFDKTSKRHDYCEVIAYKIVSLLVIGVPSAAPKSAFMVCVLF